jgi:hypothetical protein
MDKVMAVLGLSSRRAIHFALFVLVALLPVPVFGEGVPLHGEKLFVMIDENGQGLYSLNDGPLTPYMHCAPTPPIQTACMFLDAPFLMPDAPPTS